MYEGDASRKRVLVEHGFRLPSARDNRPLRFDEFLERVGQMVFLSATPGSWELEQAGGQVVEQVIRPTGLVDPEVIVKPTKGQIDDLMHEIRLRTERDERVLVTTLTKKMAEDLTDYLLEHGFRVRYLHSEVDTLRRVELLRELRQGEYDVLVGINLLREGLDLPEVSLVAILDADPQPRRQKRHGSLDGSCGEAGEGEGVLAEDGRGGAVMVGGGGGQVSRGKAAVPETRSRGGAVGAATEGMARAELAQLIQDL